MPAEIAERLFLMFDGTTNEDAAAARFKHLYGEHPEYILEVTGRLWVGPVPEVEDAEHATA